MAEILSSSFININAAPAVPQAGFSPGFSEVSPSLVSGISGGSFNPSEASSVMSMPEVSVSSPVSIPQVGKAIDYRGGSFSNENIFDLPVAPLSSFPHVDSSVDPNLGSIPEFNLSVDIKGGEHKVGIEGEAEFKNSVPVWESSKLSEVEESPQLPSPSEAVSIAESILNKSYHESLSEFIRGASKEELDLALGKEHIVDNQVIPEAQMEVENTVDVFVAESMAEQEIPQKGIHVNLDEPVESIPIPLEDEIDKSLNIEVEKSVEKIGVSEALEAEEITKQIIKSEHNQIEAIEKEVLSSVLDEENQLNISGDEDVIIPIEFGARLDDPRNKTDEEIPRVSVDDQAAIERKNHWWNAVVKAFDVSQGKKVSGIDVVSAYNLLSGETNNQKSEPLQNSPKPDGSNGYSAEEMLIRIDPSDNFYEVYFKVVSILESNPPYKRGEGNYISPEKVALVESGIPVPKENNGEWNEVVIFNQGG